jgi:Flp pilus assembly protein protease CpaA
LVTGAAGQIQRCDSIRTPIHITKTGGKLVNGNEAVIYVPLVSILISLVLIELKTTVIPDKVLLPSAVYFLIARGVIGPEPWWHYVIALLGIVFCFVFIAYLNQMIWGKETIGGGAIKLTGVIGAALGFHHSLDFGVILIGVILLALIIGKFIQVRILQSSMYVLLSFVLVWLFR